jgi:co-chaperonin GroES (HSP10)
MENEKEIPPPVGTLPPGPVANVEAYKIKPLGKQIMVVADLPPIKSKEGLIDLPADPTVEDYFRKGTVVAIGPDVKKVKIGQKIIYPFNDVYELERYYRRTYSSSVISKWIVMEDNVIAVMEPAVIGEPKADDVIHTLKAADLVEIRKRHYENLEAMARAKMSGRNPQNNRIITPDQLLGGGRRGQG